MSRFTAPITTRLADPDSERVRRNHEQRLSEVASLSILGAETIRGVVLPASTPVMIAHGLGRAPSFVGVSCFRLASGVTLSGATSAPAFVDFGSTSQAGQPIDRSKVIQIGQFLFPRDITVDVLVM